MRIIFVLLFVVMLFPSCAYVENVVGEDEVASYDIDYELYPSTALNVKALEITNSYKSPMREPNIEHYFPVSIFSALENMFRIKLLALGDKEIFKITVERASVVSEPLPVDVGFLGNFKKEPVERLVADVVVRFSLVNEKNPNVVLSYADIKTQRTKLIYESATDEDLTRAYLELTQELVGDVNKGLRSTVRKYFSSRSF